MPFVTKLSFQSGDRAVLDRVVAEIKTDAERKGVQLKGPRAKPATTKHIPQFKQLFPGDAFDDWNYTTYTREIEIVGYDEFAKAVAHRDVPDGIHVDATVEQVRQPGYRS